MHQEGPYCYTYSPFHPPLAQVKPGETVCIHTVGAFENKMTPEVKAFSDVCTYRAQLRRNLKAVSQACNDRYGQHLASATISQSLLETAKEVCAPIRKNKRRYCAFNSWQKENFEMLQFIA